MNKLTSLLLIPVLLWEPFSMSTMAWGDAKAEEDLEVIEKNNEETRRVFEKLLKENEDLAYENRRLIIELEDMTRKFKMSEERIAEIERVIEKLEKLVALPNRDFSSNGVEAVELMAMIRPSDLESLSSDSNDYAIPFQNDAAENTISSASSSEMPKMNINTVTEWELKLLPGVDELLAKQMVANRPYDSVWDLMKLPGVEKSQVEALMSYLTIREDR